MNSSLKEESSRSPARPENLGARRAVKSSDGVFSKLTKSYREWRELPKLIRMKPARVKRNFNAIFEGLIDYRLALMNSTHIAKNVNRHIWDLYEETKLINARLMRETNQRAFFLRTNKYLKNLLNQWNELSSRQETLLESISRAPASLKFYNMMMTYQEIRQRERSEDADKEFRYNEAYKSLELALDYIEEFIRKRENNVFEVSKVLNLDEARQQWSDQLSEINDLQASGRINFEQVIEKINLLKNTIFEAPTLGKSIHEIEKRFFRLSDDHELLTKMYNKSVISADELDENRILITELIPKTWIAGDDQQLNYYLKQVETFLNTYETPLQEELAFEERHSPWAKTGEEAKEVDELEMLTSFVKIMINAIESRESHMGEHSSTVARLAVNTAKLLKWEPHEIKYLEVAGLLHDVGKIWIPESLLTKAGPLTDNEYQVLRMHPYYSAKIVESISAFKEIVPWVYYHHERWDGAGYPEGLRREEIPLGASIIAVAEAFSSMIFNTLSRKPLTIDEAFDQIREESGKQFDPEVTEPFITVVVNLRKFLEKLKENGFAGHEY